MADFTQINEEINDNVNTNGTGAITGAKLNQVLRDMITAVNAEKQDPMTIDATPNEGSTNPVQSGGVYDALGNLYQALSVAENSLFGGVVGPLDSPTYGDDYRYCYLALQGGRYENFNNYEVNSNALLFYWLGSNWGYKSLWATSQFLDNLLDVKANKVSNATSGNFAGLDANGNLTDSGKKASDFATASQGAKADTAYQKPSSGIPESDLSSDVRQALQKHFKGWWPDLATLKAAITATEGDSAYVKDASPATTWSIYVYDATATTDNNWADSGTDADTTYVQTFANGEELNEVHIVDDLTTGGVNDVLSAEQGLVVGKHEAAFQEFVNENQELHEPINWLDFNSPDIIEGKYINPSNGSFASNTGYEISGYIPVKTGETYKIVLFNTEGTAVSTVMSFLYGINEYDENKSRIRTLDKGVSGATSYTPSSDAKYFRFCTPKANMKDGRTVLYYGERPSTYSSYFVPYITKDYQLKDDIITEENLQDNSVGETKIKDNSVSIEKTKFSKTIYSKNLFDGNLYLNFLNNQGNVAIGGEYSHSGKISVIPGESYHISLKGNAPLTAVSTVVCMCFYHNGVFDSYLPSQTTQFTVPSTANQFAFSVQKDRLSTYGELQLEKGTSRTSYEEYWSKVVIDNEVIPPLEENSVGTNNIQDGAITQSKLSGNITIPSRPNKFDGWQNYGEIAPTENIKINKYFRCRKGFVATALITGTIESVRLHVMDWYLDVDQTNLSVSPATGSTMLVYPHGLQLGTIITILVDMGNGNSSGAETTIKIVNADGNVFTKTSVDFRWANGYVKLDNNNTNGSITVSLAAYNKNLNKKIWLFGDSYLSYGDPEKWITKMFGWGYNNLFLDQQSGENATQSFADLGILLESGAKPSYIVWCLGMNSGTDSNGHVNSTWLSVTQQLIELCQGIGCELILATIPSTPTLSHVKLNEWVRNSGYRYIDFAAAVEDGVGTYPNYWRLWGDDTSTPAAGALLKSDKVHPTQYGAVELAARVLVDFPEITIID